MGNAGMQNCAIDVTITSCNTHLILLGPGHFGLNLLDPGGICMQVSKSLAGSFQKYSQEKRAYFSRIPILATSAHDLRSAVGLFQQLRACLNMGSQIGRAFSTDRCTSSESDLSTDLQRHSAFGMIRSACGSVNGCRHTRVPLVSSFDNNLSARELGAINSRLALFSDMYPDTACLTVCVFPAFRNLS